MATSTVQRKARTREQRIAAVRAFNRFYTKRIGLLGEGFLGTPYTLTEGRVIFELAQRRETEVVELRRLLGLDPGYLSRILARFERDGLVKRRRSEADRRRQLVALTAKGRRAWRTLDRRSSAELGELLAGQSEDGQRRLVGAMRTIGGILDPGRSDAGRIELRPPGAGDHGWVLERHGELYAREQGWGERFEALVAGVVSEFLGGHDPERERCWIATLDGERAGCVYCTRRSPRVAQLRLLLVEPWARGHGIGGRLVSECIEFARGAGYRRMMLWTNGRLASARSIYDAIGFEQVSEAPSEVFDSNSVGQELWLEL